MVVVVVVVTADCFGESNNRMKRNKKKCLQYNREEQTNRINY